MMRSMRLSPCWASSTSVVVQYMPSRYSSTKVGTLEPRFMSAVRSLRTTLPGKAATTFSSSASIS